MMDGKLINTHAFYSEETILLLRKACDHTEALTETTEEEEKGPRIAIPHGYNQQIPDGFKQENSSSSDGEGEDNEDLSSPSQSSDESEAEQDNAEGNEISVDTSPPTTANSIEKSNNISQPSKRVDSKRKANRQDKKNRERIQQVKQYRENLAFLSLPTDEKIILKVPHSLLGKENRRNYSNLHVQCKEFLSLATNIGIKQKKLPVVVLLLRSGRFAAGVFEGERCLTHRAFQRYTVRKGQGKAQSSLDSSKRKAKSMGAQLRRAGEQNLKEDIQQTMLDWKDYILRSGLILLSCPKTMKTTLFSDTVQDIIGREDPRLRKVPFDVGRPTFQSVCVVHEVMMTVRVCEGSSTVSEETKAIEIHDTTENMKSMTVSENSEKKKEEKNDIVIPLSDLHEAASQGDLSTLVSILANNKMIDQQAGADFKTPLHFAAESSSVADPDIAADCVSALLIQGHANPCVFDVRNRPPYFLATHEKVRVAFRKARATLGEDYCDWEKAKVGPALTEDDIQSRKEKEAEKKRKKKQRQKAKKAQEKAQAEEMNRRKKEEEEQKKQMEDAKRIRDGLQPRTNAGENVCDFCQVVVKGRKRQQMFKRLDYSYCTTDCLQQHKRELMARAAIARLGS